MFPCLQCNIKRSLQSECKAAAQESKAAAVISTDQPPLSYMRFVVAAPFVSSDRFDDRSCRHCFPTVRDIPPRRICHPPLSESSLGAQAVRWDAIYIPPTPRCNPRILSLPLRCCCRGICDQLYVMDTAINGCLLAAGGVVDLFNLLTVSHMRFYS